MDKNSFIEKLNEWGEKGIPFLFIVDFEFNKPLAFTLEELKNNYTILYDFNGISNVTSRITNDRITLRPLPLTLEDYRKKFDKVYQRLHYGDSYLVNLTCKTPIEGQLDFDTIFNSSKAKYKLKYRDEFVLFSPEIFVQIRDGMIYSFPMKGTIDASILDARKKILNDKKEMAEHVTIVDLIRNDLSVVAEKVTVDRFRYIDEIKTTHKTLLQVSSKVSGRLPHNYQSRLGTIIASLLPAGSVSGAPKKMTVNIIRSAEEEPRGYYTGVCGLFDGDVLDSGVMIRYIEQLAGKFFYRSGGGITTQSRVEEEYDEVNKKIYVPVD